MEYHENTILPTTYAEFRAMSFFSDEEWKNRYGIEELTRLWKLWKTGEWMKYAKLEAEYWYGAGNDDVATMPWDVPSRPMLEQFNLFLRLALDSPAF